MTYDNILKRCLEKVPSDVDTREGSMIFTALAPICLELASAYFNISNMIELTYIETAYGEYLDLVCSAFGVTRIETQKCLKKAEIITDSDILNQKFSCGEYVFVVIEYIGDNIYILEAEDYGEQYDDIIGTLTPVLNISDISSASILETFVYSCEQEDDESLRARAIERVFYKPFSGNISDYTSKVTEIDGVSYVKIFSADSLGESNVHLVLLDSQKQAVSNDILTYADELFNGTDETQGIAPIGHNVSFSTCVYKDISISATIKVSNNSIFDNIKQLTIANVQDYIDSIDFENDEIAISRVMASILGSTQILDVSSITINGQSSNFILQKTSLVFEMPNIIDISIVKSVD